MRKHRDVTFAAVMTAPRYESVWARNQIERALNNVGIPLTVSGGVFYGQCMQRMLEDLLDKNVEYALTVDFDSVFTGEHVRRLLNIIVQEEHIDAIAPVQPKRGKGSVMATNGKNEEMVWKGEPIKVASAHFGLTVLDLNKLRAVPKPWFHSIPDEKGEWSDNRVDDDVSFWKSWFAVGNSLYLDPGTRLGHLEELITVFNEEMKPIHLYPSEWEKKSGTTVDS